MALATRKRPAAASALTPPPPSKKKVGVAKPILEKPSRGKPTGIRSTSAPPYASRVHSSPKVSASVRKESKCLAERTFTPTPRKSKSPLPTSSRRFQRSPSTRRVSDRVRGANVELAAVGEVRAYAAEARAKAGERRASAAESEVLKLKGEVREWKQRAMEARVRLEEEGRKAPAMAERASVAQQGAARAEGSAGALREQAGRAQEAERRAGAAEARAAKAEGRVEVLCDLHKNLPRMIRAVASTLTSRGGSSPSDTAPPVKAELVGSPLVSTARVTPALYTIEDVGSFQQTSQSKGNADLRASSVLRSSASASQGVPFDDPMKVLEEMERLRTRGS